MSEYETIESAIIIIIDSLRLSGELRSFLFRFHFSQGGMLRNNSQIL